jgi:ribosomal protein L11 methyltransferase
VLVAGANRRLNRLEVAMVGGTSAALRGSFDLVVANLLSAHLVPELPRLVEVLRPGGSLVYSGALLAEGRELLARFRAHGLRPLGEQVEGEWTSWRLRAERGA